MISKITNFLYSNFNIAQDNILAIYAYGSTVYGTSNAKSDHDFIVVIKDSILDPKFLEQKETIQIPDNIHISLYDQKTFSSLVENHEISALECLFLEPQFVFKEEWKPDFIINLPKLRKSFSEKSSNSFVKARKKLRFGEEYIGKKSMFHSFRIIYFGIQLAKYGKITNYKEANYLFNQIVLNPINDEQYYKDNFLQLHNKLMTEFRLLAPKD